MKLTQHIIDRIRELVRTHSVPEVAKSVGCSISSVNRVIQSSKIDRTGEEKSAIRSRVRTDLIRAERRRAIFGLDQKSGLKVFSNKERNTLKYCLRRKGYIFPERGVNKAFFNDLTVRDLEYEMRGRKLGIQFLPEAAAEKITI